MLKDESIIIDDDEETNKINDISNIVFFNVDWIIVTIQSCKDLLQNKRLNDSVRLPRKSKRNNLLKYLKIIDAYVFCLKKKSQRKLYYFNFHYGTQIFEKGDINYFPKHEVKSIFINFFSKNYYF